KSDAIELRAAPVSRADELLTFFDQARQAKEQAAALDQIIRLHHEFTEPEKQLQPLLNSIEETARRNQRLNPAMAFELVIARDDLLQLQPTLRSSNPGFALERLIVVEEPRLAAILPKIPSAKERRILHALPAALGERWTLR